MKLKVSQSLALIGGLRALDGQVKVVKDADRDKVVTTPYKFSAAMRFVIAQNISALASIADAHQQALNGLIREMAPETGKIADEQIAEYSEKISELLDLEREIDIATFVLNDLALDTNPIPGTVLAALIPAIKTKANEESADG